VKEGAAINVVIRVSERNQRVTTLEQEIITPEQDLTGFEEEVKDQEQTATEPGRRSIDKDQKPTEPKQRPTQPDADHAYLKNQAVWWDTMLKTENRKTTNQEDVSQVQCGDKTTMSKPETDENKTKEEALSRKDCVLTKSEKREKLAALRAEKKLLESTEDEESWQQSEFLRLYSEASYAYLYREPDSDAKAFKAASDLAKRNYDKGSIERKRKRQRMNRIELDVKRLVLGQPGFYTETDCPGFTVR
jgi:hypothetical protein